MNTTVTVDEIERAKLHLAAPSFFGMIRSELLKMSRRWSTWIPLIVVLMLIFAGCMIRLLNSFEADIIKKTPLDFLYSQMNDDFSVIRITTGLYLLLLVAYVIGLEYQMGTIRVLLSRGVNKVLLLTAKVTSVVIVALLVLIASLIVVAVAICIILFVDTGNLQALNTINAQFWSDAGLYILTILINMGVTILLATAATVLGRSLTIGLCLSLVWFPIDNILVQVMKLGYGITKNDLWQTVTAYFLGPNLNTMSALVLPAKLQFGPFGLAPLVTVNGAHTLWVTLVYALIFAAVAVVLTWKRDVKE